MLNLAGTSEIACEQTGVLYEALDDFVMHSFLTHVRRIHGQLETADMKARSLELFLECIVRHGFAVTAGKRVNNDAFSEVLTALSCKL